jgi:hypothetical protein
MPKSRLLLFLGAHFAIGPVAHDQALSLTVRRSFLKVTRVMASPLISNAYSLCPGFNFMGSASNS